MTEEQTYTVGQLAEAAGVTPRTIRYYTAEELLPPPDSRGRYALYGEDHLLRLRLIARLKGAYLPLGEIKARLDALSTGQVAALLAEHEPAPPSSAADYVSQVLASTTLARTIAEDAAGYAVRTGSPISSAPHAAPGVPERVSPSPPAPLVAGRVQPAEQPLPAAAPPQPDQQSAAGGGLIGRLLPRRRAKETPGALEGQAGERWRRVELAPGVELHIREPLAPEQQRRVEALITYAGELLQVER
jgi:DNA-binding transcriptional MerR regulator